MIPLPKIPYIYAPYLTVYLVISLPKIPYTHRIYMVLANPTYFPHRSDVESERARVVLAQAELESAREQQACVQVCVSCVCVHVCLHVRVRCQCYFCLNMCFCDVICVLLIIMVIVNDDNQLCALCCSRLTSMTCCVKKQLSVRRWARWRCCQKKPNAWLRAQQTC